MAVVAVRVMLNVWVLTSARVSVLPWPETPKKASCPPLIAKVLTPW
jgi:hypothetical protein